MSLASGFTEGKRRPGIKLTFHKGDIESLWSDFRALGDWHKDDLEAEPSSLTFEVILRPHKVEMRLYVLDDEDVEFYYADVEDWGGGEWLPTGPEFTLQHRFYSDHYRVVLTADAHAALMVGVDQALERGWLPGAEP